MDMVKIPGAEERVRILRIQDGWLLLQIPTEADEREFHRLMSAYERQSFVGAMGSAIKTGTSKPEPWQDGGDKSEDELAGPPERVRPRLRFFPTADALLEQLGGLLVPVGEAA